jgi:hypothetical protein
MHSRAPVLNDGSFAFKRSDRRLKDLGETVVPPLVLGEER